MAKYIEYGCASCTDDDGEVLVFALREFPLLPERPRCPGCGTRSGVAEIGNFDREDGD